MSNVEIHHGFVTIGACKINFAEAGVHNATTLIMLHGFPDFWYSWRHQIQGLSGDFHVIALDQRGYNLSDKPAKISDYSINFLVNDVKELAKQLDLGKFTVVGHDWGGAVAWEFANRYPSLLSGLIVVNCPPLHVLMAEQLRNGKQLKSSYYIYAFQFPQLPEYLLTRNHAAMLLSLLSRMNPSITPDEKLVYRKAFSTPDTIKSGINYYRCAIRQFLPRAIGGTIGTFTIRVPTSIVWGIHDSALQATLTRAFPALCKNGYEIHYINAGHFAHQEKPGIVNALISRFCKKLP
jgi:epoxide hydrolase 4